MTDSKKEIWSGLDLAPLPYESTLSVIWRFSWRNAISTPQLVEACRGERTFLPNVSFYKPNWIDSERFAEQTGWNLPSDAERDIASSFAEMLDVWFVPNLRICPLCMEEGYHSHWFQFRLLLQCPLHGCELRCTCQDCGVRLGEYVPSQKLFRQSYHCISCANPIAGAPLHLRNHLDLRERRADLERAFRPLANWLAEANEKLMPVRYLCRLNGAWRSAWTQWCRPFAFLQSVGHALHPLPMTCEAPMYRELTFIRWRATAGPLENISKDELRLAIRGKGGEAIAIYRSILQHLQRNLSVRFPEIGTKSNIRSIDQYGPVKLWTREPHELGFRLFRTKFERGDVDLARSIETAQLWDEPSVPLPWDLVGVPKTALRAIYLATYANIVHSIEKARKVRSATISSLDLRDQTLVAHSWWQEGEVVTGFTVFPTIEGFSDAL